VSVAVPRPGRRLLQMAVARIPHSLVGRNQPLLKFCLHSEMYFDMEINDLYILLYIPLQQFYQPHCAHMPFLLMSEALGTAHLCNKKCDGPKSTSVLEIERLQTCQVAVTLPSHRKIFLTL
jgi:hypothetical protein